MNRYTITNLRNGLVFMIDAESEPEHREDFGTLPATKISSDCDEWELQNGTEVSPGIYEIPRSYSIEVEDLSQQIEEQQNQELLRQQRIDRLKNVDINSLPQDIRQFLDDVRRITLETIGEPVEGEQG
jgi:hypothetical protein